MRVASRPITNEWMESVPSYVCATYVSAMCRVMCTRRCCPAVKGGSFVQPRGNRWLAGAVERAAQGRPHPGVV